jgi:hypothetical protein
MPKSGITPCRFHIVVPDVAFASSGLLPVSAV